MKKSILDMLAQDKYSAYSELLAATMACNDHEMANLLDQLAYQVKLMLPERAVEAITQATIDASICAQKALEARGRLDNLIKSMQEEGA